jgi:hypothetical protein
MACRKLRGPWEWDWFKYPWPSILLQARAASCDIGFNVGVEVEAAAAAVSDNFEGRGCCFRSFFCRWVDSRRGRGTCPVRATHHLPKLVDQWVATERSIYLGRPAGASVRSRSTCLHGPIRTGHNPIGRPARDALRIGGIFLS